MKKYYIKKSLYEDKFILWGESKGERSYCCYNIFESISRKEVIKYVRDHNIKLNRWCN